MTVSLRAAEDADLPFLLAVYASTREEELAPVPWTPEQKLAFITMQFRAQHQYYQEHYTGADWLVVEVDGEPAGRLYLHTGPDEIRIVDIALLPAFRGEGTGETLVRKVIQDAEDGGLCVRIHVEKQNPARSLYERLGFVIVEDRGVYDFMERPRGPLPAVTLPS